MRVSCKEIWKVNKCPMTGKVLDLQTLEWLIQLECVSYVGAQAEPCDLVRWCQEHSRSSRSYLAVILFHISQYYVTMCLTLVNANISSHMTCTPVVIFGQISSDPMNLFFYILGRSTAKVFGNLFCMKLSINWSCHSLKMQNDIYSQSCLIWLKTWISIPIYCNNLNIT